jgi:hypothetical protein
MNSVTLLAASTAFLSCLSSSALAGWTSGGGHLRTTEQNPWFVQNTKTISYCIDIDETNFGQTRDVAKSKIQRAIAYWKHQFSISEPYDNGGVKVILGSQEFTEVPCGPQVDVAFKFGVLDGDQEQFLKDPSSIVGIAVRTSYDDVQLRGKGFVYVSPEHGRLALRGKDLLANRWNVKGGKLLEFMLIHELGHVFGMPHLGDNYQIMSERFPDTMVHRDLGGAFADALGVPNFLGGNEDQGVDYCDIYGAGSIVEKVLGIPRAWKCIKIVARSHNLKIYAAESLGQPYQLFGSAISDSSNGEGTSVNQLVLTDSQRVFVNVPDDTKALYLYTQDLRRNAGTFIGERTGIKSQIIVTQTPESFIIDGTAGEEPISLGIINESTWQFNYNSRMRLAEKRAHGKTLGE